MLKMPYLVVHEVKRLVHARRADGGTAGSPHLLATLRIVYGEQNILIRRHSCLRWPLKVNCLLMADLLRQIIAESPLLQTA